MCMYCNGGCKFEEFKHLFHTAHIRDNQVKRTAEYIGETMQGPRNQGIKDCFIFLVKRAA